MSRFWYEGITELGKAEQGDVTAASEGEAFEWLRAQGVTVLRLSADQSAVAAALPWYRRDFSFGRSAMSLTEQADAAQQMALLFRSHLPVSDVITILARSAGTERARRHYERVGGLVSDGVPLAEAFLRSGEKASPLFISLLKFADLSPDPGEALQSLAGFFRRQDQAKRQLMAALVYPAILVTVAIGVFLLVALFLAPNLAPMFEAMNQPVPMALAVFAKFGVVLSANWPILVTLVVVVAGVAIACWQIEAAQVFRSRLVLAAPVAGRIARTAELSRITHCTAMLLKAGQTLPEALSGAADAIGGDVFRSLMDECTAALESGLPASTVLAQSGTVPPAFLELFRVGEATNSLDIVLPMLAQSLDDQLDREIDHYVKLLTPVFTLVLGGGIALLVFSVMSAILSVNDLAQ